MIVKLWLWFTIFYCGCRWKHRLARSRYVLPKFYFYFVITSIRLRLTAHKTIEPWFNLHQICGKWLRGGNIDPCMLDHHNVQESPSTYLPYHRGHVVPQRWLTVWTGFLNNMMGHHNRIDNDVLQVVALKVVINSLHLYSFCVPLLTPSQNGCFILLSMNFQPCIHERLMH